MACNYIFLKINRDFFVYLAWNKILNVSPPKNAVWTVTFFMPRRVAYSNRLVCPSVPFFVQSITLKLCKASTRNFIGRYISLRRCAVHKNHNYRHHTFGVIAHFHTWIFHVGIISIKLQFVSYGIQF